MFEIKFKGVPLNISTLNRNSTLGNLKSIIYEQTSVAPENQKLIGLKPSPGFILSDELTFNNILLPSNSKVMLIGSTDEQIKSVTTKKFNDLDEINDDQECDELETDICQRSEYVAKIERRIKEYKILLIENPRPDSKLLILDIDYTIFDHRSTAENVRDLMRPFLHEFLEKIYPYYDIGIWSATGLPWIRTKLYEMGLISKSINQLLSNSVGREQLRNLVRVENNLNSESISPFKISLLLDEGGMISVDIPSDGVKEVKPLKLIWERFPQWGPHNSIMFDDIRRNFIMNPQSGLKIKPYKNATTSRNTDRELLDLAKYLIAINKCNDFTKLNHRKWRRVIEKCSPKSSKRAKKE